MYKRILVAVDGSETSGKALAEAIAIARESGGEIHLLHCVDELAYVGAYSYAGAIINEVRESGAKLLNEAADTCRAGGVSAGSTFIEAPGEQLGASVAKQARKCNADLVVVGTHGRRGVDRLVMGSGAEQIVRVAPCPVLVIRGNNAAPG